jgi:hypothetical protein
MQKPMEEILRVLKWVLLASGVLMIGVGAWQSWGTCNSGKMWLGPSKYGTGGGSLSVNCLMECCKPDPWKCRCDSKYKCFDRPDHPGFRK